MTLIEVDAQRDGGLMHVMLAGELDLSTADEVEAKLSRIEEQRPAVLALDLSRLTFLDSSGLRLIVRADQRAREDDRRLVIVQGPETIRRVFSITHLDEQIEVVEDVAQVEL